MHQKTWVSGSSCLSASVLEPVISVLQRPASKRCGEATSSTKPGLLVEMPSIPSLSTNPSKPLSVLQIGLLTFHFFHFKVFPGAVSRNCRGFNPCTRPTPLLFFFSCDGPWFWLGLHSLLLAVWGQHHPTFSTRREMGRPACWGFHSYKGLDTLLPTEVMQDNCQTPACIDYCWLTPVRGHWRWWFPGLSQTLPKSRRHPPAP